MASKNRGSISAFAVCSFIGMTTLAGLVFDGGRVISAYAEMSDVAENAARFGCQQVAGIRSGKIHVDSVNARVRITSYLSEHDLSGLIDVDSGGARVTVTKKIPMKLLSLIGIDSRTVTVTRSAHVVSG